MVAYSRNVTEIRRLRWKCYRNTNTTVEMFQKYWGYGSKITVDETYWVWTLAAPVFSITCCLRRWNMVRGELSSRWQAEVKRSKCAEQPNFHVLWLFIAGEDFHFAISDWNGARKCTSNWKRGKLFQEVHLLDGISVVIRRHQFWLDVLFSANQEA